MDAVALNSTVHPGSRFFGPALGGILMASIGDWAQSGLVGAAMLFYLIAAGYVANFLFLYSIHLRGVVSIQKMSVIRDMVAGLRFVVLNPVFGLLIGMTYFSQFFGWSVQSLFPVFAKDVFRVGPDGLGYMHSALGAGNLLGAVLAANLTGIHRRGWLILGGLVAQGILLGLFAHVPWFSVALVPLVLAGLAQSIFNVTAQSTLQYLVPNEYRGRVMGMWGMTYTAVQPSGQLTMGIIAGLWSAPWAVTLGGVLVLGFALFIATISGRIRNLARSAPSAQGREMVHTGSTGIH